jgi:parallel beta-helix repeat protein
MARPLFCRSARRPAQRPIRNPIAQRSVVGGIEQLEPRKVLATFVVASAADAGPQTLRDAILRANATPGADVIQFAIPAAATSRVIAPATPLPAITDSVAIDARSQPGLSLDGTALFRNRAASYDGLQFSPTAVNSSVAGLRFTSFRGTAIVAAANGFQLLGSSLTNNDTGLALRSVANGRIGTGGNGNSFTTNTTGLKATGTCSGTVVSANTFSDNGVGASIDSATGLTLGGTEKTLATYAFTSVAAWSADASQGAPSASGLTADAAGNLYGITQIGNGTVFRIANDATRTRTTLVSFQGSNGSMPVGPLTLDAAGNIYGVTQSGEANRMGTVFKIANDGRNTLTTLAAFSGKIWPGATGGLALDASGNLYGSLRSGGASGLGTVFQVTTGSQPRLTTLATFTGVNGSFPNGGLAVDAAGNVFGTTSGGAGNATGGTVFRIANDAGRTLSTLVTFTGPNGYRPQAGLTADAAGNLYGTTRGNGQATIAAGGGTVFMLANDAGRTFKTLAAFRAGYDQYNPWLPSGRVVVDAAGNLFGVAAGGGAERSYGAVYKIANDSVRSVSIVMSFNRQGNGGYPDGTLAIDRSGTLYGASQFAWGWGSSQSYVYQLKPTMASNVFAANYYGILAFGMLTGTRVQGNAISGSFSYGIGLNGATGLLVGGSDGLGNTITTGSRTPGNTSLYTDGAGVAVTGGSAGTVVQGNLISGNAGTGIQLRRATGVAISRNTVLANGGYGISTDLRAGLTLDGNVLKGNGRGDVI